MTSSRRILIVDDDGAVLESLRDELGPSFEVTCAGGGQDALQILRRERFDLILSDVRMPGMDGVELLRHAKAIDPDMVQVLLTGYSDEDARIAARQTDGAYKLNKPWRDELEIVLRRALEHRERVRRMYTMVSHMDRLAGLGRSLLGVIHEMGSPLSYVQANVNVLARDLDAAFQRGEGLPPGLSGSEMTELVGDVRDGVARIVELVQKLRAYGAATRPEPALVDLRACVENAQRVTRAQFKHRVAIEVRAGEEPVLVSAHAHEIEQILVNLLFNGAEAMDWKGTMHVAVSADAGHARVEVTDEGRGIPPDVIERVFEPFFTTKELAQSGEGGLGLGLAISRDIAVRHGGRLIAASPPGRGATFTLELPRAKARA